MKENPVRKTRVLVDDPALKKSAPMAGEAEGMEVSTKECLMVKLPTISPLCQGNFGIEVLWNFNRSFAPYWTTT
jgi:hypothetical protein